MVHYAIEMTRHGAHFKDGAELDAYLTNPTMAVQPCPPFKFVVASSERPAFATSGRSVRLDPSVGQSSGVVEIWGRKRKGFEIDVDRRRKVASATARPDYCQVPEDTQEEMVNAARSAFSCSIKRQTQSNYKVGVNYLKACERMVGRNFSNPLTEGEKFLFTTYLSSKGRGIYSYIVVVFRWKHSVEDFPCA